jgi:hypothetical protein
MARRKELTREQWLAAIEAPKPRFKRLVPGASRTVRLRGPVDAPTYWFARDDVHQEDDKFILDPDEASVSLVVDGKASVLFYLTGAHLDSCTFAFHLTPRELGDAVAAMKRARLARFILPAASYAVEHLPESRRPMLEDALRALVRSGRARRRGSKTAPRSDAALPQQRRIPHSRSAFLPRPLLDLSGRDLRVVPAYVANAVRLKSLTLSGNSLRRLPEGLVNLTELEELDISSNEIKVLPRHVFELRRLRILRVDDNLLSTIPAEIAHLTALEELHVSGNRLATLPREIGALKRLRVLHAITNRMTRLPREVGQLEGLEALNLGENRLTRIPPALAALAKLRRLELSDNELRSTPDALGRLPSLRTLLLDNNRLSRYPAWIRRLPRLASVNLAGNPCVGEPGRARSRKKT